MGAVGLVVILAVAWFFSTNRRAIRPQLLAWGLGLQLLFALLVLKTPLRGAFETASKAVEALLRYAEEGSSFLFGPLGKSTGPFGVLFAFQVLPIVIFIAALFGVLYYRDEANVEEAADLVEDAFRISNSAPEEREIILEVVS